MTTLPQATRPISNERCRSILYQAADRYLELLEQERRRRNNPVGSKVIQVLYIIPERTSLTYLFVTREKPMFADNCDVWIRGHYIPGIKPLTIMKYHSGQYAVRVLDELNHLRNYSWITAQDIQLVSDLRFLIRRLQNFYLKTDLNFNPPLPPDLPELPGEYTEGLSEEQIEAINSVFCNPISYISGAPGTGKTKMVLSRCILRYVLNKNRVFLLAPTNNAVEQMLRGILPVLRAAGIPLTSVYRLGASSEEFSKEFPEVVGDTGLESLRQSLETQKQALSAKKDEIHKQISDRDLAGQELDTCTEIHEQIIPLLSDYRKHHSLLQDSVSDYHKTVERVEQLNKAVEEANTQCNQSGATLHACESAISENQKKMNRWGMRAFHPQQFKVLQKETKTLLLSLPSYRAEHNEHQVELRRLINELQATNVLLNSCSDVCNVETKLMEGLSAGMWTCAQLSKEYLSVLESVLAAPDQPQMPLDNYVSSLKLKFDALKETCEKLPMEAIERDLEDVSNQLSEIESSSMQTQRKRALVLAGTIDSSLYDLAHSRDNKELPCAHVFLDEAGYTSLGRGLAIFAANAPVTMLGDHKQLPPVCEVNKITRDDADVCLWEVPMPFYSEFAYGDLDDLYLSAYCSNEDPSFYRISVRSLNKSYRFGVGLGSILAKYVYTPDFQGVASASFEVIFLNCPASPGKDARTSLSERLAITNYLKVEQPEDVAILSPYKNQVKLLKESVPHKYLDSVLTIHRAQGREWDTVILSLTDNASVRPFFTNSNSKIGKSVLNTAISRCKRRLVIACDVSYWGKCRGQLIYELLQMSAQQSQENQNPSIIFPVQGDFAL